MAFIWCIIGLAYLVNPFDATDHYTKALICFGVSAILNAVDE